MAQYWDSRCKIEKVKSSIRVTCLIQTTLTNRLWKSQTGRRKKSIQKAQRYKQNKTKTFEAYTMLQKWGISRSVNAMHFVIFQKWFCMISLLHCSRNDCVTLKKCYCTIAHFKLYVHQYRYVRNIIHHKGALGIKVF